MYKCMFSFTLFFTLKIAAKITDRLPINVINTLILRDISKFTLFPWNVFTTIVVTGAKYKRK